MVVGSALLASSLFACSAVLFSLRFDRNVAVQTRSFRDNTLLFSDMSGSHLGKSRGMLTRQPAATSSMLIPPNGAAPAMAVSAQQQLPASSTSLATNSASSNFQKTSIDGANSYQESDRTGSPHQPITENNNAGWSQPGSPQQDASQLVLSQATQRVSPGMATTAAGNYAETGAADLIPGQQAVETATASGLGAPMPGLPPHNNQGVAEAPPTNLGSNSLEFLDARAKSSETPSRGGVQDPASCGDVQDDVDYPGNDLELPMSNTSLQDCCKLCISDHNCIAWTYAKKNQLCFLKGGHPRGALTAVSNPDTISGMPSQVDRSFPVIKRTAGQSLFCFSLVLPWSYEKGLVQLQYLNGQSIFGCDEYAVYSNQEIQVADGVVTKIVDSDLRCKMGGEFGTCLNTPVFLAVWKRILTDDRPHLHDWTVKVDPDAVFFPARLRAVLVHYKEMPRGIYLNNCRFGLHGPLEVFSRNAVDTWGNGREICVVHFNKTCSGPCKWGEDMFIDQCLLKVLNVSRAFEPNLLVEDHCAPPDGWQDCSDPMMVSFHPFKNLEDHQQCIRSAEASMNIMIE